MFGNTIKKQLQPMLPAYCVGTLNKSWRPIIRMWLSFDGEAASEVALVRQLQIALSDRPLIDPPAGLLGHILTDIRRQPAPVSRPVRLKPLWILPPLLLVAALLLLWQALPPAITLEWAVQGQEPLTFRLYRAEADDKTDQAASFQLISELPAESGEERYVFKDFRLAPGKRYLYRLDVVDQSGRPAISQTVIGDGFEALVGQASLLLIGILLLLVLWEIGRQLRTAGGFALWPGLVT